MDSNNNSNFAIFRTDASQEIGAGHLMRCLTLANTLADSGWRCAFAVGDSTPEIVPAILVSRHEIVIVNGYTDIKTNWPNGCDLLVVDHYGLDYRFEKKFRNWARSIFVIDDLADRQHYCDFLLDANLGRGAKDYSHLVPKDCQILSGSDFVLLRPQFFLNRIENSHRDYASEEKFRICISFGATDHGNVTGKVLMALKKLNRGFQIDIALSSAAPHINSVRSLISSMEVDAELQQDEIDMAKFFSRADLAIGAGGSTAWERSCLGIPSIVIITAENQKLIAQHLEKYGAAIILGRSEEIKENDIVEVVDRVVSHPEILQNLSLNSSIICDGLGSRRVTQIINSAFSPEEMNIQLRPATMEDAQIIFEWQSAPETRRYARDRRVPERAEHFDWMQKRLKDVNCIFNIIMCCGVSVGVIRLDCNNELNNETNVFEVSIFLDPQRYRQGIALTALKLVRELIPLKTLVAHVHSENKASQKLFSKADYKKQGEWFYSEVNPN